MCIRDRAFIELFKGFQKQMDGRCLGHNITNPIITFDDDTHAHGHWHLFGAFKSGEESKGAGVGFLEQGYYDDDYVKIDGKWYISTPVSYTHLAGTVSVSCAPPAACARLRSLSTLG